MQGKASYPGQGCHDAQSTMVFPTDHRDQATTIPYGSRYSRGDPSRLPHLAQTGSITTALPQLPTTVQVLHAPMVTPSAAESMLFPMTSPSAAPSRFSTSVSGGGTTTLARPFISYPEYWECPDPMRLTLQQSWPLGTANSALSTSTTIPPNLPSVTPNFTVFTTNNSIDSFRSFQTEPIAIADTNLTLSTSRSKTTANPQRRPRPSVSSEMTAASSTFGPRVSKFPSANSTENLPHSVLEHTITTSPSHPIAPSPQLYPKSGSVDPFPSPFTEFTRDHFGFASQETYSQCVALSPMASSTNIQPTPHARYFMGPTEAAHPHVAVSVSQVPTIDASSFTPKARIEPMTSGHSLLLPLSPPVPACSPQPSQRTRDIRPFRFFDRPKMSFRVRRRPVASKGLVVRQSQSSIPMPTLYPPNQDTGSQNLRNMHDTSRTQFAEPSSDIDLRRRASNPLSNFESYEGATIGLIDKPALRHKEILTAYCHRTVPKKARISAAESVGTLAGLDMKDQAYGTTSSSLSYQYHHSNVTGAQRRRVCEYLKSQDWVEFNEPEPPIEQTEGFLYELSRHKQISTRFNILYESECPYRCLLDVNGERCSFKTPRKDLAQDHVRKHFNYTPFKCDDSCGKLGCTSRFSCPSRLKDHIRGGQPKTCEECGNKLKAANLARHKKLYCNPQSTT